MDRRTQSDLKALIFILLFLASFITFGQCSDSIKVVYVDSCARVQMSTDKFTEFYSAKKNLELLSEKIPNVKRTLDSLHSVNRNLERLYQTEIDSLNKQRVLLDLSLKDCSQTLTEVDIENLQLTKKVATLRRRQFKMFGFGSGVTAITILIIKSLIK